MIALVLKGVNTYVPPVSVALPAFAVLFVLYLGLMVYVCISPRRKTQ